MQRPRRQNGYIMNMVEKEYGQPFWDVVAGFGADGESIHATALILGYKRGEGLRALVKAHDMEHLFTAKKHDSNGWRESIKGRKHTDAQIAASRASMERYNGKRSNGLAFEFDGHYDTFKGHAERLGVNYTTAWMRRKRGMTVEQALFKGDYYTKTGNWAW